MISVVKEMLLCLHLVNLSWLGGVAGVITNQGMGWGAGGEELQVRPEFDYRHSVCSAGQSSEGVHGMDQGET